MSPSAYGKGSYVPVFKTIRESSTSSFQGLENLFILTCEYSINLQIPLIFLKAFKANNEPRLSKFFMGCHPALMINVGTLFSNFFCGLNLLVSTPHGI